MSLLDFFFLLEGRGLFLIMGNHCGLWVGLSEAKSRMIQLTFYIGPTSAYFTYYDELHLSSIWRSSNIVAHTNKRD